MNEVHTRFNKIILFSSYLIFYNKVLTAPVKVRATTRQKHHPEKQG